MNLPPGKSTKLSARRSLSKLGDSTKAAGEKLKSSIRAVALCAGAFPPLKSALDDMSDLVDALVGDRDNDEDLRDIFTDLQIRINALDAYIMKLDSETSNGSVSLIINSMRAHIQHVKQHRGQITFRHSDVTERARKVETLLKQLHEDVELRTWENTTKQLEETRLERLSPVYDAIYNSSYATTIQRGGCTPGTRQDLLKMLQCWAQPGEYRPDDSQSGYPNNASGNHSKVFWMNGMAGTGKTTISYSLCEWLEANAQLGASFFCSRTSNLCQSIGRIIPTIAYQLGRFSPAYRSALCKALRDDPDAATRNIQAQFDKLVVRPMQSVNNAVPNGVVVVVDALDECYDNYGAETLLNLFLTHAGNLPIKFFVASRPDPLIREKMLSFKGLLSSAIHLHDIEASIVEGDIKKFLEDSLAHMFPCPTSNQILQLTKRAGSLFIYAATLVRYICPRRVRVDSASRLQKVLKIDSGLEGKQTGSNTSAKLYEGLDALYRKVLELAFHEDLESEETEIMKDVLETVVCVKEPVTVKTLAGLLGCKEKMILHSLDPLYSVLHVPEGRDLVSTLHASFPDFLLSQFRAGELYYCNEFRRNLMLVQACFNIMKQQLRFNICDLETSFVPDCLVPDLERRIETSISSTLLYACRHWSEHLQPNHISAYEDLYSILQDFLSARLVFWMEVLNVTRQMYVGIRALQTLETWCKGQLGEIVELAHDAWWFVTTFSNHPVSQSTPHIYVSMLRFWPDSNPISRYYSKRMRWAIDIEGTAVERRQVSLLATWSFEGAGFSASVSPDGTQVVLGMGFDILVVDGITGLPIIGPLKGHRDRVSWVEFSPDGSQIVSGSYDCSVLLWAAQSGTPILGPLEGHKDGVLCVRFSHHGALIASSSRDKTILVWNSHTGKIEIGPLIGHTDSIRIVEFSPDDKRLVSGSRDGSCWIWDVQTGNIIISHNIHSHSVQCISISPDGSSVVSGGADFILKLWDINTGELLAEPFEGHTNSVESVQFSPNGVWIASASSDMTVRLWDIKSGKTILGPLEGHLDTIYSVVFTPDGSRLVTCAVDSTLRVWDLTIPCRINTPVIEHTDWVASAYFSNDNARITSASGDGMICVWCADDGTRLSAPLIPSSFAISSLTTSPDDSRILIGSNDGSIRVWDGQSGEISLQLIRSHGDSVFQVAWSPHRLFFASISGGVLELWDSLTGRLLGSAVGGHTEATTSIRFSPDSTKLCSCSTDRTACVWDTLNGLTKLRTLEGHTDSVLTAAFSPNGFTVASGSGDCSLRLWDVQTAQTVGSPLEGHTDAVTSVDFLPDGAYIVSCSDDFTIRVWETQSGQMVAGPFTADPNYVKSVRFSPDGSCIVSAGADLAIRVWDFQTMFPDNDFQNVSRYANWVMDDDGWVKGPQSEYLVWVPPDLRTSLLRPQNTLVISPRGWLKLGFDRARIGDAWVESYDSVGLEAIPPE